MKKNKKIVLFCVLCAICLVTFCDVSIADENVFSALKDKTSEFVRQLRVLAYVISCFGIVMFTFLAISGKINFKHLGYIFISLCMLSVTGGIIDYFSGGHADLATEFNDDNMGSRSNSSLGH